MLLCNTVLKHLPKNSNLKMEAFQISVKDIGSSGFCQGSFIHLLCLLESFQPSCHVNSHLHSHLSSACGSASSHLGVCCLHFTASLIDLASSVSRGELHLGQSNLDPALSCKSQTILLPPPPDYSLSLRR